MAQPDKIVVCPRKPIRVMGETVEPGQEAEVRGEREIGALGTEPPALKYYYIVLYSGNETKYLASDGAAWLSPEENDKLSSVADAKKASHYKEGMERYHEDLELEQKALAAREAREKANSDSAEDWQALEKEKAALAKREAAVKKHEASVAKHEAAVEALEKKVAEKEAALAESKGDAA